MRHSLDVGVLLFLALFLGIFRESAKCERCETKGMGVVPFRWVVHGARWSVLP